MSKKTSSTLIKSAAAAAISSLLALSVTACDRNPTYVKCYGVSKKSPQDWIGMPSGECKKLANSHAEPLSTDEAKDVAKYTAEDYVKCYGVAAASMNDCGTKTSACGGTVATPSSPDAWITVPKGICEQLKGGVIVLPEKK